MSDSQGAVELLGFQFEAKLGSGGFAEVFRYQQEFPRRSVAIKLLRSEVTQSLSRALFEQEANVMASLSSHPAIVTIYQVGIAGDHRPYLVMEYCSKPNLEQRYLSGPLSVAEVLQLVIRLSGAVETAHRAGILHLDIKPSNVLTTDFGWPALTDFGIAQMVGQEQSIEQGLSLPWSSPEAVRGQALTKASDIYSLAATAYTLLAGQPPFGDSGQGQNQLIRRITAEQPAPIARPEIPHSLQALLQQGLAQNPEMRLESALHFGRALQGIEQELGLPNTPIDVPDNLLEDLERTRASYRKHQDLDENNDDTVLSSRSIPTEPDDSTIQVKRARKQATEPEDRTEVSTRSKRKIAKSGQASTVPDDGASTSLEVPADPRVLIPQPAEQKIPEGYRIREFTPRSSVRVAPGPLVTTVTVPADVQAIAAYRKQHRVKRNRGLAALVGALLVSGVLVVCGVALIFDLVS